MLQYRYAALLVLCILALVNASKPNEELRGYSIITLSPVNETESIALRKLLPDIDILSHVGTLIPGADTDAMISPLDLEKLRNAFPSLKYKIKVDDMAEYLRNHEKQVREAEDRWSQGNNRQKRGDHDNEDETVTFFDNYRSFDHIKQYLAGLQQRWPHLIRSIKIGESIEKNELLVYVVTNRNSTAAKRKVLFNGGQHAREWLAFSSVLYSMTQLLLDHQTDPTLLDQIEFHFIPVMNPDGYEYSRLRARMWRKNRRQNLNSRYIGVDLNRNWPTAYGIGASSSPSSDIYKGTAALSEPETKAVDDYIKRNGYGFRAHVDFHCYGRDILRRYASSNNVSPDDSIMKEVGDAARDNIIRGTGVTYVSARGSYLGLDGGCMPDWTYTNYGMISYTIELSDGDFVLPPSEIRPTGKQALLAITTIANFARQGRLDASAMQWTAPSAGRK